MMLEKRMQHELIMWFSQTYPDLKGALWGTFNEDARHKKNLGMQKGVSDLIFFNNVFAGLELKAVNARFHKKHILHQIEWGQNIIKRGGFYFIGSDLNIAKQFITDLIKYKKTSIDTISYVIEHFKSGGKTIIF